MLRRYSLRLVSIVALLASPPLVQAAPPAPMALSPAVACDGCHGPLGHSQGPSVPSLAGQSADYFVTAMQAYRAGKRPATVMGGLAKGYGDTDFHSMAAYYAGQRPTPQTERLDAALIKAGATVHYKHCNTCHLDGLLWSQVHGNRGYEKACSGRCHLDYGPESGNTVPLIGGQWFAYLEAELADFQRGARPMSARKSKAFTGLSADDLRAVAAFYASQQVLNR